MVSCAQWIGSTGFTSDTRHFAHGIGSQALMIQVRSGPHITAQTPADIEKGDESKLKVCKRYRIAALIVDYAQSFSHHSTPSNPRDLAKHRSFPAIGHAEEGFAIAQIPFRLGPSFRISNTTHVYLSLLASRSDSSRQRMSSSRTVYGVNWGAFWG